MYVKGEKTKEDDHAPDGYKSVTVETGVYNDTFIEILSGLSEGDSVWVPPVDTTSDLQKMMQGMSNPHGGMGGGMSGGMGGPPAGNAGGAPNGMR